MTKAAPIVSHTDLFVSWAEAGETRSALWRSEAGVPPPARLEVVDDSLSADAAYRLACEGTALLWCGDFQNARQLLQAMKRRIERKPAKKGASNRPPASGDAFHLYRMARAQRARTLGRLVIPVNPGHVIPLRRAPDVTAACEEAYGAADAPYIVSLRELQGVIGAYEWHRNGVDVPVLGAKIHPSYGVFSPVRGEYLDLVAEIPLPAALIDHDVAFDIGTGTGVLAAILAKRGVARIVATDQDPRALACASENVERLRFSGQIEVKQADLFPAGRAGLIVCNPPWLPGKPGSRLESAVYDADSRMLREFLRRLPAHLVHGGEGWLILSDLAELIGLRRRDELLAWIDGAGLEVLGRADARPKHPGIADRDDPFHAARAAEVTSLWRLRSRITEH